MTDRTASTSTPTAPSAARRSTTASRVIAASPEALYAAFMDPAELLEWLPPSTMTGEIHAFDGVVGGGYDMSLYYPEDEATAPGKTAEREDRVNVRFVELDPPRRIVEAVTFVTDDTSLQGEMILTVGIADGVGGSEVTMLFENLPPGLDPAANEEGTRQSLQKLAEWMLKRHR
jgi:uncharacterized protein YndB with AHSA1/START domain